MAKQKREAVRRSIAERLERAGWFEHSRKQCGCVLHVWWQKNDEVLPQGHAYREMVSRRRLLAQAKSRGR